MQRTRHRLHCRGLPAHVLRTGRHRAQVHEVVAPATGACAKVGVDGRFATVASPLIGHDICSSSIHRRQVQQRYRPKDVAVQQEKVKAANALAFIAPVYFVGFPAILKGWIERVFSLGFAFALTPDAWRGDIGGRIPLLTHEKALIIQTTIFDKAAYDAGLRDAMRVLIDEFGFRYPGIKRVEHEYFYAVHGADSARLRGYLDRAQQDVPRRQIPVPRNPRPPPARPPRQPPTRFRPGTTPRPEKPSSPSSSA